MYLMKVLHLDRLSCFFWSIFLVIFLGTVLKPHTKACPYGRALVPSSLHLTITAFLPAYRPLVTTTTLPPARERKERKKRDNGSVCFHIQKKATRDLRGRSKGEFCSRGRERERTRERSRKSRRRCRQPWSKLSHSRTMNRSQARVLRFKTHLSAYFDRENEPLTIPSATQSAIPNREKDPLSLSRASFRKKTHPESARATRIARNTIGRTPRVTTSNHSYLSKI